MVLVASFFAILLTFAGHARAYELMTTADGDPWHWTCGEVVFRVDPALRTKFGDDVHDAVKVAARAWDGIEGAPRIKISEWPALPLGEGEEVQNAIYLAPGARFKKGELAVTDASSNGWNGEILRATVLVNDSIQWAINPGGETPTPKAYDLQSALTHEFGHVLGLADSRDAADATMWPTAQRGDVSRRTIEEDDEQGVVAAYSADTGTSVSERLGCSVSGARAARGGWMLWASVLLVLVTTRMRRHRRGSPASTALALCPRCEAEKALKLMHAACESPPSPHVNHYAHAAGFALGALTSLLRSRLMLCAKHRDR